jgi:hypothetical protein
MHCLFCKQDSTGSRSREHIIPESLGNTRHTLPPGVVCDQCNNYFSRAVEKPFLESDAVQLLRFHHKVPSKRGVIPPVRGTLLPGFEAKCWKELNDPFLAHVELEPAGIQHLFTSPESQIVFPFPNPPADIVVSRFLAKAGLEAMAARLINYPGWLEYLVPEPQLDLVRNHARRGTTRDWPTSVRRIYPAEASSSDELGRPVQTVHEYDILQTEVGEWYFVMATFGLELALNLGGPDIDGYLIWIKRHHGASPLYSGKNAVYRLPA